MGRLHADLRVHGADDVREGGKEIVNNKRWTRSEDALLVDNYPTHGAAWPLWSDLLPGRTRFAIRSRASALGIQHSVLWSHDEDELVRRLYPIHREWWDGWADVLPGRSKRAVRERASILGVTRPMRGRPRKADAMEQDAAWSIRQRKRLVAAMGGLVGHKVTQADMARVEAEAGHSWKECVAELKRIAIARMIASGRYASQGRS